MPAKKPTKAGGKQQAANDTATPASGHPWFPDTPAEKIAKLVVKRVAYEDRKGLPGAGTTVKANLTPQPVPPPMLTTEGQIAESFGAGYFEVWAMDAANRFACGQPYVVQIAGPGGVVPKYVREFEGEDEDEALAGGMSETEKVLRLQLAEERDRRKEERAFWESALRNQERANQANFEAVTGLVDRVIQAQSMAPTTAPVRAEEDWFRKRLETLEERLENSRKESSELAVRVAKKGGSDANDPSDWFSMAKLALPSLKETFDEHLKQQRKKLELEEERMKRRAQGVSVGGVTLPNIEDLRANLAKGWVPTGERLAIFRRLHTDGMLPPAYETLLTTWLREDYREPGEAS